VLLSAAACPLPAEENIARALDLLIESSTDIDAANAQGQTALHIAVMWSDPWVISRLLAGGADPLRFDAAGYSPISYVTAGESARLRSQAEMLAVVALFRDAGLEDDPNIDTRGTRLSSLAEFIAG
jgi:ankyrin repeat protein